MEKIVNTVYLDTRTVGSHMYGTNTAASDIDLKTIYLPALDDVLLGKKMSVYKKRVAADGTVIGVSASMSAGGVEEEFHPLTVFMDDFFGGQAWAMEYAHKVNGSGELRDTLFKTMVADMVENFSTNNLAPMVGFAVKQCFDYVRRAERMALIGNIIHDIETVYSEAIKPGNKTRLYAISDFLLEKYGSAGVVVEGTTSVAIGKNGRANISDEITEVANLKINGRVYLGTVTVLDFYNSVKSLHQQYGDRVTNTSTMNVDWKSLSHAVRVYRQVSELHTSGVITFPRPDTTELINIKLGKVSIDEVKNILRKLDDEVQLLECNSILPAKDSALQDKFQQFKLNYLLKFYAIDFAELVKLDVGG